jgi:hypothetical protein
VTNHDFIFSNERRPRIARHAAFWTTWWLSYLLLFHIPVYTFKGWGFDTNAAPLTFRAIQQIGLSWYIIKLLIFSSLLAVVMPQAIFTYVFINWILPKYFYQKKNPFVTAGVIIAALLIYYFIAGQFQRFHGVGDYVFGLSQNIPTFRYAMDVGLKSALRQQLSSLPIIVGLAVMIKLIKRWWQKQQETEQLARENAKAELQLLKAQIHPHFLFNTLNNIYFFTLSNSSRAPEMIEKLTAILQYILNECKQPLVPVQQEMKMIHDYMALEEIRYGSQMKMSIETDGLSAEKMIAPLLLIPFVENSFKHGASKMITDPWINLQAVIEGNDLYFSIFNSRPSTMNQTSTNAGLDGQGSIGLKNVKKRLELLYPGAHELNIVEQPTSFSVYLKIQLQEILVSSADNAETKKATAYAMA